MEYQNPIFRKATGFDEFPLFSCSAPNPDTKPCFSHDSTASKSNQWHWLQRVMPKIENSKRCQTHIKFTSTISYPLNWMKFPDSWRLHHCVCNEWEKAVADPGFPRRGCTNCKGGGANLLFLPIFPKNCMKLKKFSPRGGEARIPGAPPPPWIRQWRGIILPDRQNPNHKIIGCVLAPIGHRSFQNGKNSAYTIKKKLEWILVSANPFEKGMERRIMYEFGTSKLRKGSHEFNQFPWGRERERESITSFPGH